jgi:putative colanic acid biosynthesis acetyltransferase WcaF
VNDYGDVRRQTAQVNILDIAANRRAQKYSSGELRRRLLWSFGQWLFHWSPRPFFAWRRFVLRCFGAQIGEHVHIYNSAVIYFPWKFAIGDWSSVGEGALIYNLAPITIGRQVTISQRAHLCAGTHDYTRLDMPLLKPPIHVGDQAWVCADAFIGPGVNVGTGAVAGARSVVVADVEPWTVVMGNPAKTVNTRQLREAG